MTAEGRNKMKFNNAYKGIKFLNASEIIGIINLLIYIAVSAVIITVTGGDMSDTVAKHFYEITGSTQIIVLSNYAMLGSLIISYIVLLIGISKAKTEDSDFDKAFSFVCMGIVAHIIYMFARGWFGVLFAAALGILLLFFRLRVTSAVGHIAEKIGRNDMKDKVKFYSAVLIALTVIQFICVVAVQVFSSIATLMTVTSNIFSLIRTVIFIIYLSKALKMLKEQNGDA